MAIIGRKETVTKMSNIIKAKTYLPYFMGFYETAIQYRLDEGDIFNDTTGMESDIVDMAMSQWDNFVDYKTYEAEVGKRYVAVFMEKIKEHVYGPDSSYHYLRPLVDSLKIEFAEIWSPKEYNFQTDKCEVNIEVDIDILKQAFFSTPNVAIYLENTHKSRSGFMSFFRHDVATWAEDYCNNPGKYYVVLWSMLNHIFSACGDEIEEAFIYDAMEMVQKTEYLDFDKLLIAINKEAGRYYEEWADLESGNYSILFNRNMFEHPEYGNVISIINIAGYRLDLTDDKDNHRLAVVLRMLAETLTEKGAK